jgi:hypothetical protein
MELYLESCRFNPTVNWILFTDQDSPERLPDNVRQALLSREEFSWLVEQKLGLPGFLLPKPYKICDLRPAFGRIFEDYIEGYDLFGFGDLDVVYGNLRIFLTDEVLSHSIVSFHPQHISGHFSLFANSEENRNLHLKIEGWREKFSQPQSLNLDESGISPDATSSLLFESYSTPMVPHIPWKSGGHIYPTEWYWREGTLTNDLDNEEFLYFHFMVWKGGKWGRKFGGGQFERQAELIHQTEAESGWRINEKGFWRPQGRTGGENLPVAEARSAARNAEVSKPLAALTRDKGQSRPMLMILPINERIELLPYFLRYYSALGVTRFVCGLYNGESNPLYPQIAVWASHYDLHIRNTVLAGQADHYLPDIELPGLNRIREEFAADYRWFAIADLDEFHYFGGPNLPEMEEEAERRGCEAVHGIFFDRVSADGGFPEINGPLDKTFPLVCNLTARAGQPHDKITLARSHVSITSGHHQVAARVWRKAVQVHHFKWSRGVGQRIEAHYLKAKAMGIARRVAAMRPQLELVRQRVNLRDPRLRVFPAPRLGI